MHLPDNRRIKNAANESIKKASSDPGKLVAFHTAIVLALSLVVLAIDFVLERQIGNTGGLSGVGVRSVLETVQTVLQQVQSIALPFWQIGWLYATVKIARGETAEKADLLEGFRRFPAFLRLKILKGLIFAGLGIAAAYAGAFLVMMTPLADPMVGLMNADLTNMTQEQLMAQMEPMILPMAVICCALALVLMVPFFYRFRMAEYFLLDNPGCGARVSMRASREMMRGNIWKLMRLDLSFWWFWLLTIIVSALGIADLLLPLLGITMPWTAEIGYFGAYLLAAAAQVALYYYFKAHLDVTYAHAYMSLLPANET